MHCDFVCAHLFMGERAFQTDIWGGGGGATV